MLPNYIFSKMQKPSSQAGFGLIELLVSISIVVLVTSIILVKHSSYNGAVLLRSEAYKIALQVREIQLSAVSVIGEVGDFRNVFGLHFNTNTTPNYYYTFRDSDGDSFWDSGEEVGKRNNVDARFVIDDIRLIGGAGGNPDAISIVFERPNFDAGFFTGANAEVNSAVSGIEIDVRLNSSTGNTAGEVRTVEVTKTGQITVKPI